MRAAIDDLRVHVGAVGELLGLDVDLRDELARGRHDDAVRQDGLAVLGRFDAAAQDAVDARQQEGGLKRTTLCQCV